MVDANGRARITDFGFAHDQGAAEEAGTTAGGTARWTAPEILQGRGAPSKQADVFAFAMVMVEVGSGCELPVIDLRLIAFRSDGGIYRLRSI